MTLLKSARVKLIMKKLRDAPTPDSVEKATILLHNTVREVEDNYSGVIYESSEPSDSDRMYGPRDDHKKNVMGGVRYRTRRNLVYVWNDGGFVVLDLDGNVVTANLHQEF